MRIQAGLPCAGNGLVHDAFVAAAVGVAFAVLGMQVWGRARSGRPVDDRIWFVAGISLVCGGLAARWGTWFQHLDLSRNRGLLDHWLYGNRSILGGLAGAWLGVHLGKRLIGYPGKTGNLLAPAVAAGMAVGRIGCLLTERPGTPSGSSFGIVLTAAQAARVHSPAGVALHPSFGYEIAFHLLALVALVRWRSAVRDPGGLFVLYATGYAVFRFAVEFVRGNDVVWAGLTRPQLFLLVTIPLLAWRSVVVARDSVATGRMETAVASTG